MKYYIVEFKIFIVHSVQYSMYTQHCVQDMNFLCLASFLLRGSCLRRGDPRTTFVGEGLSSIPWTDSGLSEGSRAAVYGWQSDGYYTRSAGKVQPRVEGDDDRREEGNR